MSRRNAPPNRRSDLCDSPVEKRYFETALAAYDSKSSGGLAAASLRVSFSPAGYSTGMDDAGLIRKTAAAVAPAYRSLDLANAAGLLLDTYFDGSTDLLTPLAVELKAEELTPDVRLNGIQEELGYPNIDTNSALWMMLEDLSARIESANNGYRLSNAWFLALAEAIHHELGIPVLAAENETPIAAQLQRQLGSRTADP